MPIISIVVTLIIVGVLLWLVNNLLAPYIQPPILQIINVVIVILLVLWLLEVFGVLSGLSTYRVGPLVH